MGLLLLGGGTVWFARTGKLNINIFPQNCWRAGGGRSPKFFSGHTKKKFSGHITQFPLTSRNFRENTKIFSGHQNFPEIFKFCPNFALLFARP
jgi:hypothetical protein